MDKLTLDEFCAANLNPLWKGLFSRLMMAVMVASFWCATGRASADKDHYREAIRLKGENRYREALSKIREAVQEATARGDTLLTTRSKLEMARLMRISGIYDTAGLILSTLQRDHASFLDKNPLIKAEVLLESGTIYLDRGKLDEGKACVREVIDTYQRLFGEQDTMLAPAFNKMGTYYYYIKNYDSALHYYEKAFNTYSLLDVKAQIQASYLINMGIICGESGKLKQAEDSFLKALEYLLHSNINYITLYSAYLNLGRFYNQVSNYSLAMTYLDKAEEILKNNFSENHPFAVNLLWNKANIYYLEGDYIKSIKYYLESKRLNLYNNGENAPNLSKLNMDIAVAYEAIGEDAAAMGYYKSSLEDAQGPLRVKVLRNLAMFYMRNGELDKSRRTMDECLDLIGRSGMNNSLEIALTQLRYGQILLESGERAAIDNLHEALEALKEIFGLHHRDVALATAIIGDYHAMMARPDSALHYYQAALKSITPGFSDTSPLDNPSAGILATDLHVISFLTLKARILSKEYDRTGQMPYLLSAIDALDKSISVIEKFRTIYLAEESKNLLTEDYFGNYSLAISLLYKAWETEKNARYIDKAFEICERSKAAILLAELKDKNARQLGLIPDQLVGMEQEIKKNLYTYKTTLDQIQHSSLKEERKHEYILSALFVQERKYDSLIAVYKKQYPEYYQLKFDLSVIGTGELRQHLQPGQVMLEYALHGTELFAFIITPEDVRMVRTVCDTLLARDILRLRNDLVPEKIKKYNYDDYLRFQELSHKLYSVLIQPIETHIIDRHVIVVPDGELAYLSFESLIRNVVLSDSISFRRLPYLLHDCSFSYAISSTIFSLNRGKTNFRIKKGVLAMAPTYNLIFRGMPELNAELSKYPLRSKNLPGAALEVDYIMKFMKGKNLLEDRATESGFKMLAHDYDILHFAMHARIDDANPLSSRLNFYPLDDFQEDGHLHTYEIYNLSLKGHMAVLSACSTGDGKMLRGEGVISLARAFAYAGIPSLVMTLWDVEDITSGFIIPNFYLKLSKGLSKDEALRQAKLAYLEGARLEIEAHPSFWSGYILYGDNTALAFPKRFQLYLSMAIMLFIIFTVLVILFIRRKTNLFQSPRR